MSWRFLMLPPCLRGQFRDPETKRARERVGMN